MATAGDLIQASGELKLEGSDGDGADACAVSCEMQPPVQADGDTGPDGAQSTNSAQSECLALDQNSSREPNTPKKWERMWTPISGSRHHGWVSSMEEAKTIVKFFGADCGVEFFRDNYSTFNSLEHLLGPKGVKARIRFQDIGDSNVVPYDYVPFILSTYHHYGCEYGRDKHAARKKKISEVDGELKRGRTRKRIGCPAGIKCKEVIRFPQFKAKSKTLFAQKYVSRKLRSAMWNKDKLDIERRVYIVLPKKEDHQNVHGFGKKLKKKRGKHKLEVTLKQIDEAAERLRPHIHMTPVMTSSILDKIFEGRNIFFKCELLQKTGSFQFRGALNALSVLRDAQPGTQNVRVLTHGSANFGQALASAAQVVGVESYIHMPISSPLFAMEAVIGYGGSIVKADTEETEYSPAELFSCVQEQTGAHLLLPSESNDVISGHGTIGQELLVQIADLDAIVIPVGSGELIAGVATAIKKMKPTVKVYGAEPECIAVCTESYRLNKAVPRPSCPVDTVADALNVSIGTKTWPYIDHYVDEVFPVSEEDIKTATRAVWRHLKLCIDPAGGVALAALSALPSSVKNVAVLLSSGNADFDAIKQWL